MAVIASCNLGGCLGREIGLISRYGLTPQKRGETNRSVSGPVFSQLKIDRGFIDMLKKNSIERGLLGFGHTRSGRRLDQRNLRPNVVF